MLDLLQEGVGLRPVSIVIVAEGQGQVDKLIEDSPYCPDINGVRIGRLEVDLRCHVSISAPLLCPDRLLVLLIDDRYAEISQLHLKELIDEDILRFDTT